MEVNKHINFLKRRGFLMKEGTNDKFLTPKDISSKCRKHTDRDETHTFCSLDNLYKDIEGDSGLQTKLMTSLNKIYQHLHPNKVDNRRKFSKLVDAVMSEQSTTTISTFEVISNNLDVVNIDILVKGINSGDVNLDGVNNVDGFLEQIRDIKYQTYTMYENSFVSDYLVSAKKSLRLKYDDEISFQVRLGQIIMGHKVKTFNTDLEIRNLIKHMYDSIERNLKGSLHEFIKADVMCTKDLTDENGDVVVKRGDYIEIKKLDTWSDSYISEFFAIYKNTNNEVLKSDYGYFLYNKIIDGLYIRIKEGFGSNMIEAIKDKLSGIMFDGNKFVPIENINLYWSNRGQRTKDHRLSIRYQINVNELNAYYFNTETNPPMFTSLSTENRPNRSEKYNTERNLKFITEPPISENVIKEETSDFDWATEYMETTPNNPYMLAIMKCNKENYEILDGLDPDEYETYWSMREYVNDNDESIFIGTRDEATKSLTDMTYDYLSDDIFSLESYGLDPEQYVIIDEPMINMIASDESDYHIGHLSDDDVLLITDNNTEYETLEEEIDEIDSGIEELSVRIMIADSEEMVEVVNQLTSEMEELESKKEDIEKLKYELIESSKLKATEDYYYEIQKEMTQSPINYFIENGTYGSVDEVITSLGLRFNYREAAEDIASQGDFRPLNQFSDSYCTEYFDGEDYIVFTDI